MTVFSTDAHTGVVEVFDADAYLREHPNADVASCGACGRSWDDAVSTAWTPTPAARCPFEYEHETPEARLEYLRGELRAERISLGELHELQGLADHIDPGDTELLEAAGVPEHEDEDESMDAFTLTIELGNAAMRSPADVADALRGLADRIEDDRVFRADDRGGIRDGNGNTVGRWAVA